MKLVFSYYSKKVQTTKINVKFSLKLKESNCNDNKRHYMKIKQIQSTLHKLINSKNVKKAKSCPKMVKHYSLIDIC